MPLLHLITLLSHPCRRRLFSSGKQSPRAPLFKRRSKTLDYEEQPFLLGLQAELALREKIVASALRAVPSLMKTFIILIATASCCRSAAVARIRLAIPKLTVT